MPKFKKGDKLKVHGEDWTYIYTVANITDNLYLFNYVNKRLSHIIGQITLTAAAAERELEFLVPPSLTSIEDMF